MKLFTIAHNQMLNIAHNQVLNIAHGPHSVTVITSGELFVVNTLHTLYLVRWIGLGGSGEGRLV